MKTIWKFPLLVTDNQLIAMPKGALLLSVQVQHDRPCLWALVNPDGGIVHRRIITHGTGHPVAAEARAFVGTYQINDGNLVFHVFGGSEV